MSKLAFQLVRVFCLVVLALPLVFASFLPGIAATPDDAPSRLESNNYTIDSVFFGNTGVVYSTTANVPPVITVPPAVINITTTTAEVTWQTDKPSSSIVFLGTSPGNYTTQFGDISPSTLSTVHSVPIERLTRGTVYHYKVRSADIDGNQVDSGPLTFETDPGDITPPVITTGPFLSVDSASLVTVTWETNEVSSTVVEYGVNDVTENAIGRADDLTLFHQVRISGLQPAQAYKWRVKSRDASGNTTVSEERVIATPNSPFISGFSITDVTLTSAVVQWNTSTSSTTVVEVGTGSATYDQKIEESAFVTSHVVRLSGLSSGTTYYLRVSGVDQAGNLLQSDEKIFATVIIPQIFDFQVTQITSDSALLTWRSSSNIDELIRYDILNHPDPSFIGKRFSAGNDVLVSEHSYQLTDLESAATYSVGTIGKDVFGNQAISESLTFTTLPDNTPPEILNIRNDTTIDLGSRQTVQVLVSAECSELCKVVIEYGPGASGPYDKKVETDALYSRAKFLVIPGLEPGQSYHFRIVARDRTGNIALSPDYLVLAPVQPISLLDLIFGQIRNNFGWLNRL